MALQILIVDDSPAMRAFIRRVVRLSGIDVENYFEASNGAEALAQLAAHPVDAVLTDINMPVMDGEQFLRQMEEDEKLRAVPVIVVSTDRTETRVDRMISLGARGYITKPFLPQTLRGEIEKVLGVSDACN